MNTLEKIRREGRGLSELLKARFAPDFTRFCLVGHGTGWVLDHEAREIGRIVRNLEVPVRQVTRRFGLPLNQCIHFTGAGILNEPDLMKKCRRFSFDYYHGRPGQSPMFTERFENLKRFGDRITKLRVSNSIMENVALEVGFPRERLHRIAIAINPDYFHVPAAQERELVRGKLEIPPDAFVVGSFQKDGMGWGDGQEPKWEKGPEAFVEAIALAAKSVPNLMVLLTGPARGFVKTGLEKAGVPFRHTFVEDYTTIGHYFHALDAYLISSREEGGPKAILEAMASGVPLISTRCGQAVDLVEDGQNGFLRDVDDVKALASALEQTANLKDYDRSRLIVNGASTAAANTYDRQLASWKEFLTGYVDFSPIKL